MNSRQKKSTGRSGELGKLRNKSLHIRVSDEELTQLEKQAVLSRASTAKFCRDKLLYEKFHKAKSTTSNQIELLNQLNKIGVNLNQLAHRANKNESLNSLVNEFLENLQAFKTLKKSQYTRGLNDDN